MSTKRPRIPSICCPHCGERSIVRDSVQITPTIRELRLACDNDDCGHTFLCQLSVVRTIRPSARPNPAVNLPFSNPNLRLPRARPANDETPAPAPTPANDDAPTLPAAGIDPMRDTG